MNFVKIKPILICMLLIASPTYGATFEQYNCDDINDAKKCGGSCKPNNAQTVMDIKSSDKILKMTLYKGHIIGTKILKCDMKSFASYACYDDPRQAGYEKSRTYNTYKLDNKVLLIKRFDKESNVLLVVFCVK